MAVTVTEGREVRNFIENFIDEDIAEGRFSGKPIYTRFPPEPNGYLHIGHAKAICLSFTTAEKYGGKCNLRFDDTNPVKEDTEYVESIEEDVRWLGFEWDELRYASDYFEKMYSCAVTLITKGLAYVDDLSADEIRETRGTLKVSGSDSPYRDRPAEESLQLFSEMRSGLHEDGSKVLRAKIDMSAPNINLRDPVIYRISHASHHRTGDEWAIYPMYDFAHPLEDAIEGITHSLCTLEFEDHRPLYDWVLANTDWEMPPRQIEFARLGLTGTIMSKRLLKELVDNGNVDGWDDPRMPTIAGLRRRGYTPESIREFCEKIGVAKANSLVDADFLEHLVREDLKVKVQSRNVVFDPIKIVIENYPEDLTEEMAMENSREMPEWGERLVPFGRELYIDGADFMEEPVKKYFRLFPGNEVRFKGAYFLTCKEVRKNDDGSIKELVCTYDPETKSGSGFSGRKVKGTVHWVSAKTAVEITVREYESLMIENEEGEQVLNPQSVTVKQCFAEPLVADAAPGESFQFFRHGYYVADSVLNDEGTAGVNDEVKAGVNAGVKAGVKAGPKVFNQIVGLKSSWKK
ncbi:MAG: glutamine--tRNA ligase/YqeY domain fusion protein [Clostridiales Family XIII bacterium]|nr:glutamine--tRNA ligase/YqeY domain fusion protein [Clostridiales Family XIII bacterium]